MSLEPPKESDLNKSWVKSKPDRGMKIQSEYHLTVSEGIDTEPAYFEVIRDTINSRYRKKIQLEVLEEGDNTSPVPRDFTVWESIRGGYG